IVFLRPLGLRLVLLAAGAICCLDAFDDNATTKEGTTYLKESCPVLEDVLRGVHSRNFPAGLDALIRVFLLQESIAAEMLKAIFHAKPLLTFG
uniref:hypothetical protein n=1 Tax=Pedobacter sp. TaxID=1411316 RepID=UPI003D7F7C1F